jgi:hypothetical protein
MVKLNDKKRVVLNFDTRVHAAFATQLLFCYQAVVHDHDVLEGDD